MAIIYSLFDFFHSSMLLLCFLLWNYKFIYVYLNHFFLFLKAGDGDKYYRDTQVTETITSRHTASQYRPVDFRLPVGGGQFGDISGMYFLLLSSTRKDSVLIQQSPFWSISLTWPSSSINLWICSFMWIHCHSHKNPLKNIDPFLWQNIKHIEWTCCDKSS